MNKKDLDKEIKKPKKISEKKEENSKNKKIKQTEDLNSENLVKGPTFNLVEVIIIVVITAIVVSVCSGLVIFNKYQKENNINVSSGIKDKNIKEFAEVYENIINEYVDKVDKEDLINAAIEGMLDHLGDTHTSYLDKNQTETLNSKLNGNYTGIGIEILDVEGKGVTILNVFEDTPASEAGIKAGDVITKLDKIDVTNKSSSFVSNYIKTSSNEKISFSYLRDGKITTVNIKKRKIDNPTVYKNNYDGVGYLRIESFSNTTTEQFKSNLKSLENEGINSLIIDLRNNTGGYLSSAYEISDIFIEKGKNIYQLKSKDGTTVYKAKDKSSKEYKIVILMNKTTASASEVLIMALKESYGIKTVGEKSYGKGSVQQTENLESGGMIKYTTDKWLSPKGNSIDGVGINPDYSVKLESNEIDNQLKEALKVIKE